MNSQIDWYDAFAVFRGIFDREPSEPERMAFNLARSKHMPFDEAMARMVEAWDATLRSQGKLPQNACGKYNPKTGEIETLMLCTKGDS